MSWYCAKHHKREIVKLRCPLGPIPEELKKMHGEAKAIKVYRPWRPEVDACVIQPRRMILIEAKIQKFMDGLSKLPVYKTLVPLTPELEAYRDFPIDMILLIPQEIAWIRAAALRMDVAISTEAPKFIKEEWGERDKYWTKRYLERREKRKQKLRELGYE